MTTTKQHEKHEQGIIAVLRLRGVIDPKKGVKETLEQLHLYRKNFCTLLPKTASNLGMVKKVKDYITWGEIDTATVNDLFAKRGLLYVGRATDTTGKINYASRYVEHAGKKYKKFFRLNNPRGGFERKGIKRTYNEGGALGHRGAEMSALLKKMMWIQ